MQSDSQAKLLADMYRDRYFPDFLVDKINALLEDLVVRLEQGVHSTEAIQQKLDEMTRRINDLQEEFEANDSEIETVARDSIAVSVARILQRFGADIDLETALRERDW